MPRYSKEKIRSIDAQIRSAIVRNPAVSGMDIAEAMNMDKDFIYKRMKKIQIRMEKETDRATLQKFLTDFVNKGNEVVLEMWKIIQSKDTKAHEKINAARTIIVTQKEVFDKLFDAGIFTRNLGEITQKGGLAEETLNQFLSTYHNTKALPEVKEVQDKDQKPAKSEEKQ